jgi:hypothetical protein
MQLQVQEPNLQGMFGQDSLYNTLYGGQQFDQANANQAQNLQAAQQETAFNAQNQPYNLQQLAANVGHTNAMTNLANAQAPGEAARSGLMQMDLQDQQSIPQATRNQAAYKKMAAQMSDDDYKQLTNHIATQMSSSDPNTAQAAMTAWSHLPNIALERMKLQSDKDVAGIHAGAQIQAAEIANPPEKFAKNSVDYLIKKGFTGNYANQSGSWTLLAMQAQEDGDAVGAQKYSQLADLARNADKDKAQAASYARLAGTVDLNQLGMNTVTNPSQIQPKLPPNATQQQMVPQGMTTPQEDRSPTDTGKVIMKDRNGATHLVPSDKVDQAVKFGWTK